MKQQLKLLFGSLVSVILAVFCLAASIFAWLVTNETTNINNFNIQIDVNDLEASYIIYKYDGGDVIQSQDLSLSEYDSIITARNVHNPIILELTISGGAVERNNALNLNICCTDNNLNTMSLSNVLFFKSNFLNITSQDNTEIYNQATTQLNSVASYQFVGATKSQNILLTLSNYQNYKIDDSTIKYYIKIDYEPALVADLVSLDFSSLDDTTTIVFNSDITKIEIYEVGS